MHDAERERPVGKIGVDDRLEQRPTVGTHHADHSGLAGDVLDGTVGSFGSATNVPEVANALGGSGDQAEAIVDETQDGEIAEEAATLIEHGGVDKVTWRDVNVVGAEAVEHRHRVGANDFDLAEARLVEDGHVLSGRHVLAAMILEPGLPTKRVLDLGPRARIAEEVGTLHAGLLTEPGASAVHRLVDGRRA